MLYSTIIKAVPALKEIQKIRLPYQKARSLFQLSKVLESEFNFYIQEEMKLVQEYAIKDKDGEPKLTSSNLISFNTLEDKLQYNKKIIDLGNEDVAVAFEKVTITANEIGNQLISSETISNLEGIIIFE